MRHAALLLLLTACDGGPLESKGPDVSGIWSGQGYRADVTMPQITLTTPEGQQAAFCHWFNGGSEWIQCGETLAFRFSRSQDRLYLTRPHQPLVELCRERSPGQCRYNGPEVLP